MPFAPHEIENKKFVIALRGYQTDEVEAFLRAVAADYAAVLDGRAREPVELVAEIERVMSSARQKAEDEASEILRAAEEEAAHLRREAAELRNAAQRETEAYFAEVARQAEELQLVGARVRDRLDAVEQAIAEARRSVDSLHSPAGV